jgi:hypothetical protein
MTGSDNKNNYEDACKIYDEASDWSKPKPELPVTQKRLLKLNKGIVTRNFGLASEKRPGTAISSRAGSQTTKGSRATSAYNSRKNHFTISRNAEGAMRRSTHMEEVDSVIS